MIQQDMKFCTTINGNFCNNSFSLLKQYSFHEIIYLWSHVSVYFPNICLVCLYFKQEGVFTACHQGVLITFGRLSLGLPPPSCLFITVLWNWNLILDIMDVFCCNSSAFLFNFWAENLNFQKLYYCFCIVSLSVALVNKSA